MSDDIRESQNMSESEEKTNLVNEDKQAANVSRRKFAKLGLLTAPVIMTLNSRPVLGAYQCTVSGQMSGNLSNFDSTVQCAGNSELVWMDASVLGPQGSDGTFLAHSWPAPFTPQSIFHNYFSRFNGIFDYGETATFYQVMKRKQELGITGDNKVGRKAIATLLNIHQYGEYFGLTVGWAENTWTAWAGTRRELADFYKALNARFPNTPPPI